jgi:Glycosyltransferase 61
LRLKLSDGFRARLGLELWKTRRFWRVYAANVLSWFRAAGGDRLPLQPWRREKVASDRVVAVVPAPDEKVVVTPTAYAASGVVERNWPFRQGLRFYDLQVARADEALVLPRNVFISREGWLMQRNFAAGRHRAEGLKRLQGLNLFFLRDAIDNRVQARIDRPVFVVDSPWAAGYGHLLLELSPMLALLEHAPVDCLVATSAPLSRTLMMMFEQLGVPADRILRIEGALRCRETYLPDRLVRLGASCHPLARRAFDRLGALAAASAVERPKRVFVSRAGIASRRLDNEKEVEALFVRHGFVVVRPEGMPIEDQIAIFGGATMLAGLGGSAMHNAVFSDPACPVLIVQTRQMTERRIGFVFGESERLGDPFTAAWQVNLADVEAGIRQHFGL